MDKKEVNPILDINKLNSIQLIYLQCILMANNEIIFEGKSLGFIPEDTIKKYAFIESENKKVTK